MSGQYYGFKMDPVPTYPTKKQALDAISALATGNLRCEYLRYYHQIAKNYINLSQEHKKLIKNDEI